MKSSDLISFLGKSIHNESFLLFLETNHFSTNKFPGKERRNSLSSKSASIISKLHGIELNLGFDGSEILLMGIVFFKPQSDGLQPVYTIEYPFGLYLNQKINEYSSILGETVGYIEPHYHNYIFRNYALSIYFEPGDLYKKIKNIEITLK
jgi:hypothetical protein